MIANAYPRQRARGDGVGSSATLLGVCTVYPNAVTAVWPSPGCSQVAQRWPGTHGYILYFKFTPINVIKKGRILPPPPNPPKQGGKKMQFLNTINYPRFNTFMRQLRVNEDHKLICLLPSHIYLGTCLPCSLNEAVPCVGVSNQMQRNHPSYQFLSWFIPYCYSVQSNWRCRIAPTYA